VTWPQPTRQDHEKSCGIEGWQPVRDARGRTGTHYVTYELHLPDGRILRTRISHPADRSGYGPSIWSHILRDQLQVSEAEFWSCVRDGVKPDRGVPEPPPEALPADLVYLLITRVGLAESDVATMTKDEAVARLQRYWIEGS
jgi:hypothetical protein